MKNFFSAVATIIVAAMVGCLSLGVVAVIALLLYGLVVIVFREAFGVSLPNPFDWF